MEKTPQFVPKGSTVIVSTHIPTCDAERGKKKEKPEKRFRRAANRNALYKLLEPHKVRMILSGHTHFNENWEEGNMMEHNHGTVCGAR